MTAGYALERPDLAVRPARRRRIVILTEDSKPALGGIAEYLHQLALAASATHDVLIVTSVPGAGALNAELSFQYREERWFRAQEHRVGDSIAVLRRFNTLCWRIGRPRRVQRLLAAIHAEQPDSSYVLGRLSPVTMPWCDACTSLGLPYAAIGYGLEVAEPLRWLDARRRVDCAAAADHWFAISTDTRDKLAHLGVPTSRQSLLPPGVAPIGDIPSARQRKDIRQRLGIGDHPFLFSLAYLRRRKGIDLGIEAFVAIATDFPDLRYVVGGTGPEADALRELARSRGVDNRVLFVGSICDTTKGALFADCEFFLLPNRAEPHDVEGFGIVFLEANLFGKAVIGGNNGGVPEAVAQGITGLLVDTRDATGLMLAMRSLLSDPARAASMGRYGRERARRDFAWAQRGATFVERLDALAAEHAPTAAQRGSDPLTRLLREVGHTSNRLVSGATVMGGIAARGRLAGYLVARRAPATQAEWVAAMLTWLERAFAAGIDGGVAASYHVVHGWAASYPEVTGYLIPTLLYHARTREDRKLLELARRGGVWLGRTRLPGGAICRKQWFEGNTTPSIFNTAQVIEGWCALARAGVSPAGKGWLTLARESADWLVAQQEPDGRWVRHAFNDIAHSYYARVAAPLARLAHDTGEGRYRDAARRGFDWVLGQQVDDGWFQRAGFTTDDWPTTHTIGYILEGLLQGAELLAEPAYARAAARAADRLLAIYSDLGFIPGQFGPGWRPRARWRCLTGDAQVALAWCLLYHTTGENHYRQGATRVAEDIRRTIRLSAHWPEIAGAVQGSSPPWGDYDPYRYPTHAVKFALDLAAMVGP